MSIHFHTDVSSHREAVARLIDQEPQRFITWQFSGDYSRFVLSYVSSIDKAVVHIEIKRLPEGDFMLLNSPGEGRFPTLADILATRRYIKFEKVDGASQLETDSSRESESNMSSSSSSSSLAGSLRLRASAISADTAVVSGGTGGLTSLPARIKPPRARKLGPDGLPEPETNSELEEASDREWSKGIRPVCSKRMFSRLFFSFKVIAGIIAVALIGAYYRYETHAREDIDLVIRSSQAAVDSATRELFASIKSTSISSPSGENDGERCRKAVTSWRAALSASAPSLQEDFESGCGADYLGTLTVCTALSAAAIIALMCLHTGRAPFNAPDPELEALIKAGDAAGQAAYARKQRTRATPIFSVGQQAWVGAFLPTLVVFLMSFGLLVHLVWDIGAVSGTVENAARTLSMLHPVQDSSIAEIIYQRDSGKKRPFLTDDIEMTAWRHGMWGSASVAGGLTKASSTCLDAVKDIVDPLTNTPPWIRAPLSMFLPGVGRFTGITPPSQRKRAAIHKHSSSSSSSSSGDSSTLPLSSISPKTVVEDSSVDGYRSVFDVDDPFGGTPLAGFLSLDFPTQQSSNPDLPRRRRALLLPSRAGAIQLAVDLVAVVLFSSVGILLLQEWFIKSWLCRALWCQRGDYFSEEAIAKAEAADKTGPSHDGVILGGPKKHNQ